MEQRIVKCILDKEYNQCIFFDKEKECCNCSETCSMQEVDETQKFQKTEKWYKKYYKNWK